MSPDFDPFAQLDAVAQNANEPQRFFGLDSSALAARMEEWGEPAWRGRQLAEALYRQRIVDLQAISTLPKALRQKLDSEGWQTGRPLLAQIFHSQDGTERYLVQGVDGPESVEAVWMPEGDEGNLGEESEEAGRSEEEPHSAAPRRWQRATICVSSQVGCAVNCRFCLTAQLGLQRNLSAGEIAGQVLAIFDRHQVEVGRDRVNLVFMGMGEPFLNYPSFSAAVRLLVQEVGLSPQRMTVSTSGIVPGIERFAQEPPELRPRLALSLNAPNDGIRSQIMPVNRKWPIENLLAALRLVPLRPRERITFEYVLLAAVNDQPAHAAELARLAIRSGLPIKINLIAWNPGPGIAYSMPQPDAIEVFRAILIAEGIPTYLRKPRGRDIFAACGQLKRTIEG